MPRKAIDISLTYWENLCRGSKSAFFEIYQTYYDHLYFYGIKICNDDAIVRDLIHDLFIDLWNDRGKLPRVNSVKPYLLRIMRNMTLDQIKEYQKEVNERNQYLFYREDFHATDQAHLQEGQMQTLTKALNALPDRQREILQLKYYSNCSYEQIAEITGLTYQGVRNTVYKAMKKMKKFFL